MLFQRDKRNFGGIISKWFRQPVPEARQSQSGRTQAEELDKGCLCVPGSGEASKVLSRPAQHSRSTEPGQPSVQLLPALLPHDQNSQHPQVFSRTVSRLREVQGIGCPPIGQVWLTSTSCSSMFLSNHKEWLNARRWDESFRSSGAPQRAPQHVGHVVFSPSTSLIQQLKNLSPLLLLLYQEMLPSSAGERGWQHFFP